MDGRYDASIHPSLGAWKQIINDDPGWESQINRDLSIQYKII
jgi:hypothetical protein